VIALPQLGGMCSTDIGFVAKDIQVCVLRQQLETNCQVGQIGWCQFEIEDHAAQGDQQVQFVAKDGLALGRHLAEPSTMGLPIACRTGHKIELHHRNRQTVNQALTILCQV